MASKRGLKRLISRMGWPWDPGVDVDGRQKLPLRLRLASQDRFYPIRIIHTRFLFCFSSAGWPRRKKADRQGENFIQWQ
jgi:hypothetical protein